MTQPIEFDLRGAEVQAARKLVQNGSADSDRRPARLLLAWSALMAALAVVCSGGEPAVPEEFDPRIADLVEFVEAERGLTFLHPVFVDFLTEEAYAARITERDELTEDERGELESLSRIMRAMGLVRSEFDALEIFEQIAVGGTAAFYDIESQRIVVRGTDLDAQYPRHGRSRVNACAPRSALRHRPPSVR